MMRGGSASRVLKASFRRLKYLSSIAVSMGSTTPFPVLVADELEGEATAKVDGVLLEVGVSILNRLAKGDEVAKFWSDPDGLSP